MATSDDSGGHWWNNGPLAQMRANHPWISRGAQFGPYGMAAGAVVEGGSKLYSWGRDRGYWGGTNMDPNATSMGPPADMAGSGGPPEGYQPDYNAGPPSDMAGPDPNAGPAWYNDATMNADDPMGLVPDYGQDGPGQGGQANPSARRDAGFGDFRQSANYGISNLMANGQQMIVGENGMDPNGAYMYNRRGVGG